MVAGVFWGTKKKSGEIWWVIFFFWNREKMVKIISFSPNISLINLALSPMYLSTMALETTLRKWASMLLAIAFANNVFPVPGGPYRSTPFGGLIPTRKNSSGFVRGSSMTSLSSRICSLSPPTDEYDVLVELEESANMLKTTGSTSRGNIRIIVKVVTSRATLAPATSFVLSTLLRHPTT